MNTQAENRALARETDRVSRYGSTYAPGGEVESRPLSCSRPGRLKAILAMGRTGPGWKAALISATIAGLVLGSG